VSKVARVATKVSKKAPSAAKGYGSDSDDSEVDDDLLPDTEADLQRARELKRARARSPTPPPQFPPPDASKLQMQAEL
jgi:hypothetical protein